MITEPYADLGGLEHPGPYDQNGAKYRDCPTCGAPRMKKCTFVTDTPVPGQGIVRQVKTRHIPCLARIVNHSETEGTQP